MSHVFVDLQWIYTPREWEMPVVGLNLPLFQIEGNQDLRDAIEKHVVLWATKGSPMESQTAVKIKTFPKRDTS